MATGQGLPRLEIPVGPCTSCRAWSWSSSPHVTRVVLVQAGTPRGPVYQPLRATLLEQSLSRWNNWSSEGRGGSTEEGGGTLRMRAMERRRGWTIQMAAVAMAWNRDMASSTAPGGGAELGRYVDLAGKE